MQHGQGLGDEQNVAAIEAVDPDSGEGGEEERGDLSGEADDAEEECGTGEAIDEPTGGQARHPCAHQGNALAAEVEAKISVAQGAPRVGDAG